VLDLSKRRTLAPLPARTPDKEFHAKPRSREEKTDEASGIVQADKLRAKAQKGEGANCMFRAKTRKGEGAKGLGKRSGGDSPRPPRLRVK